MPYEVKFDSQKLFYKQVDVYLHKYKQNEQVKKPTTKQANKLYICNTCNCSFDWLQITDQVGSFL